MKCRRARSPNGTRAICTPGGYQRDRIGKFGRCRWGAAPDRGEQVGGQGQVQHLLLGHVDDHALPGGHLGQLLDAEPFLLGPLEGELGEQVLTHQPVLELTGLGEQPNELLAVLDSQRRLDRQSALLAPGSLTPMLPRGLPGSSWPLASAAKQDLAFAGWRTMVLGKSTRAAEV